MQGLQEKSAKNIVHKIYLRKKNNAQKNQEKKIVHRIHPRK